MAPCILMNRFYTFYLLFRFMIGLDAASKIHHETFFMTNYICLHPVLTIINVSRAILNTWEVPIIHHRSIFPDYRNVRDIGP